MPEVPFDDTAEALLVLAEEVLVALLVAAARFDDTERSPFFELADLFDDFRVEEALFEDFFFAASAFTPINKADTNTEENKILPKFTEVTPPPFVYFCQNT